MANSTQYKELKDKVDKVIDLLYYDLDTANATAYEDYVEEDRRTVIGEISFALGVHVECLSQARRHLKQFENSL